MEARAGGVGFLSGLGAEIAGVKTSSFDGPIAPNRKAGRKKVDFSKYLQGLPGSVSSPPDDITVNSSGIVTNVVKNGKANRFFDQNGQQLFFNDAKNMDKHMIYGHFEKGDKIFTQINNLHDRIINAGFINRNITGSFKSNSDYLRLGVKSYFSWDFPTRLSKEFKISAEEQNNAGYFGGSRTYFRFGNHNGIYNLYDAGQFMWGRAAAHSSFSLGSLLNGVGQYESFLSGFQHGDSEADTQAITNGFNYQYYNGKVKGWDE